MIMDVCVSIDEYEMDVSIDEYEMDVSIDEYEMDVSIDEYEIIVVVLAYFCGLLGVPPPYDGFRLGL